MPYLLQLQLHAFEILSDPLEADVNHSNCEGVHSAISKFVCFSRLFPRRLMNTLYIHSSKIMALRYWI